MPSESPARPTRRVSSLEAQSSCAIWLGQDWSSDAARRGSAVHRVVELLKAGEPVDPMELAAEYGTPASEILTYTQHLPDEIPASWQVEVPMVVRLRSEGGIEFDLSGHTDVKDYDPVHRPGELDVIDFKTGDLDEQPPAAEHMQLLTYLAIQILLHPMVERGTATLWSLRDGRRDSVVIESREDAQAILEKARLVAGRSLDHESDPDNGDYSMATVGRACRFCVRKGDCDAFVGDLVPFMTAARQAGLQAPFRGICVDAADAGKAYLLARAFEGAAKTVRGVVKEMLENEPDQVLETPDGTLSIVEQNRAASLSKKAVHAAVAHAMEELEEDILSGAVTPGGVADFVIEVLDSRPKTKTTRTHYKAAGHGGD